MAMHFTESAALLDLPPAKKLVLMAFADSADKDTRVAIPGFDTIQRWSGLKARSRLYESISELVDEGYLARRAAGRSGRRAEFYVFPRGGCCPLHAPLPDFTDPTGEDDTTEGAAGGETPESGSGGPDPDLAPEQREEDHEQPHAETQPSTATPGSGSGSGSGSALDRTPSRLPGSEIPPNPPDKPGGNCGCGRKNCRACGTSPRAARRAQAAAEALAAEQHEMRRAAVPWCGGYRCDRTTRRVFDADTGRSSKCPDCHPDVVVGTAPPPAHVTPGTPGTPHCQTVPTEGRPNRLTRPCPVTPERGFVTVCPQLGISPSRIMRATRPRSEE